MKKELKGFVVGAITTATLMGSIAFGQGITKTIKVVFNSVNFTVNGKKVQADNILYNGNIYVSLKSTAEALGKQSAWNTKTGTASINDKKPNPAPAPSNLVVTKNNVTVKINKVVQDADSLKFYITYINKSNKEVLAADSLAKIVANGKQYEYDHDFNFPRYYETGVEKVPDSIEPGVTANSVIFFKPVGTNTINIVLNAGFEDYRYNNVKVEKQ